VTSINDTNGNEIFGITATASAVNELTVANAATGNNPVVSATGSDTNIGITLTPKGTGDVVFTSGNLVIGTSGKGIDFSATPGTGTSELLADYEEGTFTVAFTVQVGSITVNTSFDTLSYIKIGKQVYITGGVKVSSVSGPDGFVRITLPFASANSTETSSYVAAPMCILNTTVNANTWVTEVLQNEAFMGVRYLSGTAFGGQEALQFSGDEELFFNFSYTSV
jgi:hypothetical protein